jgi:hypothetical protein
MVLFEGSLRPKAKPQVSRVADALGGRPPGTEETFGKQVWLADLRDKIGRDGDSNANLTRRMLFVFESVPLCGDETYVQARRALLQGYLDANVKDHRPPRFLLNDLIRYWRTIAVDFESKMRARKGQGWGLGNAKLRLSRKALFAGSLLPVLECYRYAAGDMLGYLEQRVSLPPLDRIADAFVDHAAVDTGARALAAYDEFLSILDDGEQRRELQELDVRQGRSSPVFARVAELGKQFESGLLSLLFDDLELRRWVREYIVF